MSKELDEFYKRYSARITEMDDTPLVKVMNGGKFKLLSIEEYEEMANKLTDLEAKLAVSENTITNLVEDNRASQEWYKKQLAEKDKLINNYADDLEKVANENADLVFKLAEKEKLIAFYINSGKELCEEINKLNRKALNYCDEIDNANQDKISFAVEQLEKFRDIMEKLNENNSGYIIRFNSMRDREKFHEALDNQIKQLKETK